MPLVSSPCRILKKYYTSYSCRHMGQETEESRGHAPTLFWFPHCTSGFLTALAIAILNLLHDIKHLA